MYTVIYTYYIYTHYIYIYHIISVLFFVHISFDAFQISAGKPSRPTIFGAGDDALAAGTLRSHCGAMSLQVGYMAMESHLESCCVFCCLSQYFLLRFLVTKPEFH